MSINFPAILTALKSSPAGIAAIGGIIKTFVLNPSSIAGAVALSKNFTWATFQTYLEANEPAMVTVATQLATALAENPEILAAVLAAL